jgi:hypothetical protein
MKLAELSPEFVRYSDDLVAANMHKREIVQTLAQAQGIRFRSPGNADLALCIPFSGRGAPADENGGIQWSVSGTGYTDLTLTPSVNMRQWHGFVTNGEVTTC